MNVLKGVLEEELENSKRIKRQYGEALRKLPKGSIQEKEIRGHRYLYLVLRKDGKVKLEYIGKKENVEKNEIEKYIKAKKLRKKYIKLRSEANKQVAFLERILNGRELRSVS